MRPVTLLKTGVGTTVPIRFDRHLNPTAASAGCTVSGTATYNVEESYEDPPVNWFVNSSVNQATTNAVAKWTTPVQYVRLNVTAGSGTVTINFLQTGK